MKIRQEITSDYDEVYELVKVSFATTSNDDGTTPELWISDLFEKSLSSIRPMMKYTKENLKT